MKPTFCDHVRGSTSHAYQLQHHKHGSVIERGFAGAAAHAAKAAGKPVTFLFAFLIVLVWALTGPYFGYSDTWQLVINTGTTVVTFLMVFLIQNTQNRDSIAVQTKLDELIRSSKAQNLFVGIEHLTDYEISELRTKCEARAQREAHLARQNNHHG